MFTVGRLLGIVDKEGAHVGLIGRATGEIARGNCFLQHAFHGVLRLVLLADKGNLFLVLARGQAAFVSWDRFMTWFFFDAEPHLLLVQLVSDVLPCLMVLKRLLFGLLDLRIVLVVVLHDGHPGLGLQQSLKLALNTLELLFHDGHLIFELRNLLMIVTAQAVHILNKLIELKLARLHEVTSSTRQLFNSLLLVLPDHLQIVRYVVLHDRRFKNFPRFVIVIIR